MKVFIIVTTKLLLISLAVYLLYDPSTQLKSYPSDTYCLQTTSPLKLCAQCFSRDTSLLPNKGYHIGSPAVTSIIKIKETQSFLNCNDFLQMIDYQADHQTGQDFRLDNVSSVAKVMDSLGANFVFKKTVLTQAQYTVEPWYSHFVVLRWKEGNQGQTSVTALNTAQYQTINMYILIAFNVILLVVLTAWLADSSFINDLRTPVKISLAIIIISIQLTLLQIYPAIFHFIARLFVLNLGLFKLKVHNFKVLAFIAVGIVMTYFPFTLLLYTGVITIFVVYYGKDQSETTSVKLFLVIFYSLLLLNYSYWFKFALYLNDIPSVIIQYSVLTFIPTGIFLLPNRKEYVAYTPTDPERRSISLSGFDQDQEGTL